MSIASEILNKIRGASAVTLSDGYAMFPNRQRVLFPPARIISLKRNKEFRCTKFVGEYSDGSRIYFSWSEKNGVVYSTEEPGE